MVTLNTPLLNKIGTEIAKRVNNDIYYNEKEQIRLSLGSLIGSKLLSQTGPYFNFDIVPVAVINVGYNTEFESAGINQSKYKVYLNVKTETRLLVPFMSEKFRTENTVLIAEAVIVGDVPQTYTNIPKEEVSEWCRADVTFPLRNPKRRARCSFRRLIGVFVFDGNVELRVFTGAVPKSSGVLIGRSGQSGVSI